MMIYVGLSGRLGKLFVLILNLYKAYLCAEIHEHFATSGRPDALDGQLGVLLWAVSTSDGEKLAEYNLDSPPVFDGMIAANGRLFVAIKDGKLLCFDKQ